MMVVYSIDSPVRPAPRLMARSMLSFGTEVFFAFCTASTRVGLPERSAPPIFAATSMFLMSFANDFARRCVDDRLLVLGRRPLGMPGHASPESLLRRVDARRQTILSQRPRLLGSTSGCRWGRCSAEDLQQRAEVAIRRHRLVLRLADEFRERGVDGRPLHRVSSRARRRPARAGRRRGRPRRRPPGVRRPAPESDAKITQGWRRASPASKGNASMARSSSARVTSTIHASYPNRSPSACSIAPLQRGARSGLSWSRRRRCRSPARCARPRIRAPRTASRDRWT